MKKSGKDRSWSFLIADPALDAPAFESSVVLLLEESDDGAFGVIVNKPLGKSLEEFDSSFAKYKELASAEVYDGGPLGKNKLSIAVWYDDGTEMGNFSFGVTAEDADKILAKKEKSEAAIFSGYAGWSEGQLDEEIEEGSWIIIPADLGVFCEFQREELWEQLILRNNPIFKKFPKNPANKKGLN